MILLVAAVLCLAGIWAGSEAVEKASESTPAAVTAGIMSLVMTGAGIFLLLKVYH